MTLIHLAIQSNWDRQLNANVRNVAMPIHPVTFAASSHLAVRNRGRLSISSQDFGLKTRALAFLGSMSVLCDAKDIGFKSLQIILAGFLEAARLVSER